jgi:hypothetical protein
MIKTVISMFREVLVTKYFKGIIQEAAEYYRPLIDALNSVDIRNMDDYRLNAFAKDLSNILIDQQTGRAINRIALTPPQRLDMDYKLLAACLKYKNIIGPEICSSLQTQGQLDFKHRFISLFFDKSCFFAVAEFHYMNHAHVNSMCWIIVNDVLSESKNRSASTVKSGNKHKPTEWN